MIAAVAAAGALACHPEPGLGSVAFVRRGVEHVVDLATCRERVVRPSARRGLVSPDGRFAATVIATRNGSHGTQAIVIRDRRRRTKRTVYRVRESYDQVPAGAPGPILLFRWSGDGRWIFFAVDPQGSQSLAADGLQMQVVSVAGGALHRLGFTLGYPDYFAWCGGREVFTGGGNRLATTNKRLLVAAPPLWKARELVKRPQRAWGSVACAHDGRSIVVQSQRQSSDYNFFHTHWALWRVGLDGSLRQLTFPPPKYADESPRFAPDGSLLFVRSRNGFGKLYALRRGRLLGPLLSLGFNPGYYGHHAWWSP